MAWQRRPSSRTRGRGGASRSGARHRRQEVALVDGGVVPGEVGAVLVARAVLSGVPHGGSGLVSQTARGRDIGTRHLLGTEMIIKDNWGKM